MARLAHSPEQLDAMFTILADQQRRCVLAYFHEFRSESATVDELVDYTAEQESQSPTLDRETITISMYHNHLPKLASSGLINYDTERGVVTTTDRTEQCLAQVERIRSGTIAFAE